MPWPIVYDVVECFDFRSDLGPGDTTTQDNYMRSLTEPFSALSTFRCRMQSAKFEGGNSWEFGHVPWRGRPTPLPTAQSSAPTRNDGSRADIPRRPAQAASSSKIAFTVADAWNDSTSSGTIVHLPLNVRGGPQEITLRPDDVSLKVALVNG